MIIVKNKSELTSIQIQNPSNLIGDNFTLILQNSVTKKINTFNVINANVNNFYFKFNDLDFSTLDDGEYYVVLLHNPRHLDVEILSDNVNKYQLKEYIIYFLVANDFYITSGDSYLTVVTDEYKNEGKKITTTLMRIGEYINNSTQYNTKTKYKQYNG